QLVARLDRTDAGGRAGVDDVARLKRVMLRQKRDLLGNRPDHVAQVGALPLLAIDIEPDGAFGWVADLRCRNQLAARRRFVEVLAEVPWPPMVLAPLLQVAAGHVEPYGVAEDVVVRPLYVDAATALVKRDHELGLVVIVGALRRIVHLAAARDQR